MCFHAFEKNGHKMGIQKQMHICTYPDAMPEYVIGANAANAHYVCSADLARNLLGQKSVCQVWKNLTFKIH